VKKEAIMHVPLSEYAYAENESSICVRIRTAKDDLQSCKVYYGNRVDSCEPIRTKEIDMEKVASDDLFDYYETLICDEYTRVCYYFLLDDGEKKEYYYSRGFCEKLEANRTEYFQFPYIRREDILDLPGWANEIVMYHIFPDSFATDKQYIAEKGERIQIKEEIYSASKCGGTIKGIEENLPYLQELGVNCLYINPIFAAHSYHKYDTIDYFDIDPCMGTKQEFREFVQSCHRRGIRVILDGVFNHCGPGFFAFQDVLKNGGNSPYHKWFYQMPLPIEYKDPPNYEAFAYVKEMPKLNTGNPEVIDYFCKVGTYWIEEADIDGWRLDVANEINHDFWREFRKAVRAKKKDCFLIAEIWEDAHVWLRGDQFDSSMNYTFTNLCRDLFATSKISIKEFDEQINKMYMRYPWSTDLCQMNFLDTHDVPRFLSYCNGDLEKFKLAFVFMMTSVGIPSIFYGDEAQIMGMDEDGYRRPMPWQQLDSHEKLIAFYKQMIRLRKENEALQKGKYRTVLADNERKLYLYIRKSAKQEILVAFNLGEHTQTIDLSELGLERGRDLSGDNVATERLVVEALHTKIYQVWEGVK